MTPYLSEDWFRLWKIALREAERLDMNVWIYDENRIRRLCGGLVPEAMPEARGRGLVCGKSNGAEVGQQHARRVPTSGDKPENVTSRSALSSIARGTSLPDCAVQRRPTRPGMADGAMSICSIRA